MWNSVTNIAFMLGVHEVTVAAKIEELKEELSPYLKEGDGVLCVEDRGLGIIKNSLDTKVKA